MKPRIPTLFRALAASLLAVAATVFAAQTPAPRVQVAWAPNEKLTEVKNNPTRRGWLRPNEWQKELADEVRKQGERFLPPGEQLEVTFDDIKLAGEYEPWRGPTLDEVRILKDIYPPRAEISYRLLGADGRVLREGTAKLADTSYLQRAVINTTDPLRYDKRMLSDWMRREFKQKS